MSFLQQLLKKSSAGMKSQKLFRVQLLISNSPLTFTSYIIIHGKFDLWLKNRFSLFCNIKPWDSFHFLIII